MRIPFTRPARAPSDLAYIAEAMEKGHVSGDGPFTKRATEKLSGYLDGAKVLLTTSCTHALELSAILTNVGPGSEVVLPSFTFSSTANAFALRGAKVRFADIDPGTWTMEVSQLEAAVTPQTTHVCAMPYGGVTRNMEAIAALCKQRGLRLVEDNAHGLFARSGGRRLGTFGELGTLSFHQTKNISCGEGGALIVNNLDLASDAEIVREKGTNRSAFLRGEVDKYTWRKVGSSYLPSDILAAVLTSQLEQAEVFQQQRMGAWRHYADRLEASQVSLGYRLQDIPETCEHPAHVFAIVLEEPARRASVLSLLRKESVHATSHYEPLHLGPAAASSQVLDNTGTVANGIIRLPLFNEISLEDVDIVVDALLRALRKVR